MAINTLQHLNGSGSAVSSGGIAWGSTTTSGSLLVAVVQLDDSATVTGTPSGWTLATSSTSSAASVYVYYIANAAPRSGTETFTFSGACYPIFFLQEWTGIVTSSVVDQTATSAGGLPTIPSGTTSTTAQASELWLAAFVQDQGIATFSNPTNGFSILDQKNSNNAFTGTGGCVATKTVNATGTASCSVDGLATTSATAGCLVTFKGTPLPAAPTPGNTATGSGIAGSNIVVNMPSGIVNGNELLLGIHLVLEFTTLDVSLWPYTLTTNPAWTLVGYVLDPSNVAGLWVYKRTANSEPVSYTFANSMTGATYTYGCTVFSGNGATIEAHSQNSGDTATSLALPAVNPIEPNALLWGYWGQYGSQAALTVPSGMTSQATPTLSYGAVDLVATQALTSSGSTGTRTAAASDSISGTWVGMLALVSPAETITISPGSLPSATVGTAYSQSLTASGATAPLTWSLLSGRLPPGLTLTSAGLLSGTPTASGSYAFTVEVTDALSQTATQAYTLSPSSVVSITPTTLPSGQQGVSYSQTFAASGGTSPYTWAILSGALPSGLSLSSGGVLSGTPTVSGLFSFAVQVTDSASHSNSVMFVNITFVASPATFLENFPTDSNSNRVQYWAQQTPVAGQCYVYDGVGLKPGFAPRDLAINGNFAYWQALGTTPGAIIGSSNDLYFADQWKANNVAKSGANWTPAQGTTTNHWSPTHLKLTTSSTDKICLWQPMESWVSQQLSNAGASLTIQCWVQCVNGTPNINIGLLEWSGAADQLGGNSSGNVYSAWSSTTGTDPTWNTNYTLKGKGSIALSSSWQLLTTTVAVDASKVNLLPVIWLDGTVTSSAVLRIADVQVFPSQPVVIPSPDLLSPYRFFQAWVHPPLRGGINAASGAIAGRMGMPLSTPMRASPSATLSGTLSIFDTSSVTTVSSISNNHCSQTEMELDLNLAAALGVSKPCALYNDGGTGAILLDARL